MMDGFFADFVSGAQSRWVLAVISFGFLFVIKFTLGGRINWLMGIAIFFVVFVVNTLGLSSEAQNIGSIVGCALLGAIGYFLANLANAQWSKQQTNEASS
ncbi:hypothetical protein Q4555_11700 [Octadecabacter sp. 1_MG-2023]|uniref:hypothetical protein n=1 Tax=unclassified Octadecabacter TaxID=196158 RepID=UPI001C08854A|nr:MULTISPECIES: hypothetical protein [unclassified Octadecabacter]MBU2993821.1 hypothetical protein [Octadecabacter sp. B2R22]MDO6735333.1 hypothetical protein [Octadecabacter sp. 1_MG-2023]